MPWVQTSNSPWEVHMMLPQQGRAQSMGRWAQVASLAVPAMLSMVAEWWAAEFRALIAGWLPGPNVRPAAAAFPTKLHQRPPE
jgi:hypothetical protein